MHSVDRSYPDLHLLIDGRWIGADERDTVDVENPATGEHVGRVPVASEDDVERALEAADRAFVPWRDTSPHRRAAVLMRGAQLLRERREEIAVAMTLENGKPYGDSLGEVDYTADIIDSLASEAPRTYGHVLPTAAEDGRTLVVSEPIGPVAAFTPWNYPLTVPGRKVAAALAAGCTVVIKPAEETPASAVALARALTDAGLPNGVLNVLFGDPAAISTRLIASPVIRKVSFTGSIGVGTLIARQAGGLAKPVMLELGGHAPVLVFDDADVDAVARQALGAKIHNTGQSCGSPVRFYVHERVHERFVERFAALLDAVRVGDGFDEATEMGPLANSRRLAAMGPFVDDALARGATLAAGGPADGNGFYYRPTLLAGVPDDALVMHDEPFGPIAATSTFSDEDEVLARANGLPYGLAAYLFTSDADRALRIPRRLDVGMVSVNRFGVGARDTFFGGRKASGFGSEGGPEAVDEYLVRKLIAQG
ncbi:NAD-dependent succinate-semialdehyde dehydrogenase [Agromyces mediolanus]|uniref:NAD-dependent succinate-semialdehyde dehydrogenase n=1 Tax=Agromyces mediolanus TaxID=41986 RepID=A0A918FCK6_AGRME|nr:NAD-dependent succinate-semialdehyde dehydrogenase [Agromyces mediolanus]GGR27347.1 NAD-dependent succinate-semialdehyde dehydrogenase [Agromyces mediolanus]GLJ71912.1 NAD-dependent succinate-semialdehyde dehydrogenase [Agromyces mediolanus]